MTTQNTDFKVYEQDLIIDSVKYSKAVSLLRDFFLKKGFVEVPTQSRLSILAACEDPTTVQTYNFRNTIWPLPQTGQMWLEYEMLKNPSPNGYFCISTSYREEKNPVEGRHKQIFPMFEFETKGDLEVLRNLEKELIDFLGIANFDDIKSVKYQETAEKYGVTEINDEEEGRLYKEFGNAVLLTHFPFYTSPFWNMKKEGEVAKKIDAIICGQETIGSAERSTSKDEMRDLFYNISEGGYAELLFNTFGKKRVESELDDYLSFNFFERCGGGIGVTRLMRALEICKKI